MTSFIRPVSSPQAELAGLDVAGDALGGGADQGELPVVDRAGAVHGDVRHQPALHQVDEVARHAGPEDVGAHHQDAGGGLRRFASTSPRGEDGQGGVLERRQRRVERQQRGEVEVVRRCASGWMRGGSGRRRDTA